MRTCIVDWLRSCWVVLAVAMAIGCGVKGDPVAPYSAIPQAVSDLQAYSRRGTIALQWSIPTQDTEEKSLSDLGGFHLWRQYVPSDKLGCTSCKAELQLLADIDYRLPLNARRTGGKMVYWDDRVEKEGKYSYTITSYTVAGVESGSSNHTELMWFTPFPSAGSLRAFPGDRVVDLAWDVPAASANMSGKATLTGWNIYRHGAKEGYGLAPLNPNPVTDKVFRDMAVTNDTHYWYVVRSLQNINRAVIEGKDSPEAKAMPEDLSPPAPPLVAMAFQSPDGIVVVWEPNRDPDLAGYYLYRREETEAGPVRVSPLLAAQTMYVDKGYVAGVTYYYSLTAVDRSPRQNESDFSRELKVATKAP